MDQDLFPPEPAELVDSAVTAAGLRLVADLEVRAWGNGLLGRALAPPRRGLLVVEAMARAPSLRDLALRVAAEEGLVLLISAAVAWTLDVAEIMTDAAVVRWSRLGRRRDVVRLALHEALVNSAMHGCFEIPSDLRDGPEGWLAHSAAIERALRDPARALMPLMVSVMPLTTDDGWELGVADAGPGFDAEAAVAVQPDQRPRGRGLRLMRAAADCVAWEDGGRRARMTVLAQPR